MSKICSWRIWKQRIRKFSNSGDLRPFIWMGNICGIFRGRIVDKRVKPGYTIVTCYVLVVFGLRFYCYTKTIPDWTLLHLDLTVVINILRLISLLIVTIADFVVTIFCDKRIIAFFKKLAVYDDAVKGLGHERKDHVSTYWLYLLLIVFYLTRLQSIFPESRELSWEQRLQIDIDLLSQWLIYLVSVLKFNLLVHLVYQRFRHLNVTILTSVSWTRDLRPKYFNSVKSDDVIFLHATLVDASAILTSTYSLILLFWFANIFCTALMVVYIISHSGNIGSPIVICSTMIIEIFVTCSVCTRTVEEANSMGKYMSKDDSTLIENLTAMDRVRMQLYLMNNRIIFSAGDFFIVGLPVIYSLFTTFATYGFLLVNY